MARVILHFSISLDGYAAGPDVGIDQPMGAGGESLHDWLFATPKTDVDLQVAQELSASAGRWPASFRRHRSAWSRLRAYPHAVIAARRAFALSGSPIAAGFGLSAFAHRPRHL